MLLRRRLSSATPHERCAVSKSTAEWNSVKSAPLLSVVIPTCNRADLLRCCLQAVALAIKSTGREDIEVIVADDSRDELSELLVANGYSWVRWVRGPRRGPASNRNVGAAASHGEWIVFTDDDCIPEPGWLRAYLRAMQQHPENGVFEGKTVADRERRRLDEEAPVNTGGGYLWSCNMAISRGAFARIEGFCESFP